MLSRTERTLSSIILLVVAIITLYPIVVLVTTAFDRVNANNSSISFFKSLSFSSFKYAWTQGGFSQYTIHTAIMTVSVVVGSIIVAVLAAYAVALLKPYGSRILFYVAIIVLLQVQLFTGFITLARANYRLMAPLKLLTKLIGLVPAALLAVTKVYFIPTGPTANLHALTQINYWMNVSFKIVLVIVVVNLLVESWQYFRRFVPTEGLAF